MNVKLLFKSALVLWFAMSSNVFATDIYVNDGSLVGDVICTAIGNNANNGLTPATPKLTLAAAIGIAAATGDRIYIDTGTSGEDSININKSVEIIGAGEDKTIFKRASGVDRWGVVSVSNVKVSKLTITEYNLESDGIAVWISGGTGIVFDRVTIYANVGGGGQGAVLVTGAATSATFKNSGSPCNRVGAANYGGAFKVVGATLVIDNCSINNNVISALYGGGVLVAGDNANVTIINTTFDDNEANSGGAIAVTGSNCTVNVSGSCFNNNRATAAVSNEGGGAVFLRPSGNSTTSNINFTNCSFTGNTSTGGSSDGGAILITNSSSPTININITSCSFENNSTADRGEDIYFDRTYTPTFNVTFKNNTFFTVYSGTQVNLHNVDLPAAQIKFEDLGGGIGGNGDIVATPNGVSIDKPEMAGNYTETSTALPSTLPSTTCIDRFDGVCGTASATISCVTENIWNGTTWSKGIAPTIFEHVILNANYNTLTHGNINACQMTVKTGVTLDIVDGTDGTYVYVVNSIFNNGTINVTSKANLVQVNHPLDLNGDAISTPSISFTKNTGNKRRWDYVYWGKPVSSAILSTYNTNFDLKYSWDPSFSITIDRSYLGWRSLSIEPLVGTGFITRVRTSAGLTPTNITLNYTGTSNNGNYTAGVKYFDGNDNAFRNYTLLGNPYPGAISFEEFYKENSNEIYGTVYLWTSSTLYPGSGEYVDPDYATYNLSGGVGVSGATTQSPTAVVPNGYIASAQGFMVRPKTNNTVTFNNKQRTKAIPSNNQFFRGAQNSSTKDRYWLRLANETGKYNEQLIGYFPNATNDFDEAYDGPINSTSSIKFYSVLENEKLIIQGKAPFSVEDKVAIAYDLANPSNTLTISLSKKEGVFATQDIYIHDKMLGFYQNLSVANYMFISADFPNRFEIVYKKQSKIQEVDSATTIAASFVNNELQVTTTNFIQQIELYDLNGRLLLEVSNSSTTINSYLKQITLPNSIYILNVKCVNGISKSIKLINN